MSRFGIFFLNVIFASIIIAADIDDPSCVISYNNEFLDHIQLDTVTDGHPVNLTVIGGPNCQLRALVVGGGGASRSGSGGGSGYILYGKKVMACPSEQILVEVGAGGNGSFHGGHGQRSSLSFLKGNSSFMAEAGQDGHQAGGCGGLKCEGNGFSGGGGYCIGDCPQLCDGGSAGSNGVGSEEWPGGNGTGENISLYHLEHWEITPGVGGKETFINIEDWHTGGGGGGVLVNGYGPHRVDDGQGEGYGGGGGSPSTIQTGDRGLRGVVLIEVFKSPTPTPAPDCAISCDIVSLCNCELHDHIKLDAVTGGDPVNLTVHGSSNCQLRALLVGGGGNGVYYGGGSGYILYGEKAMTSPSEQVLVEVGAGANESYSGQGQRSSLSFLKGNLSFMAEAGQNGLNGQNGIISANQHGGNGFSGGGGFCNEYFFDCPQLCDGGSAGSNGRGLEDGVENGGNGTGEDIGLYHLEHWKVTPGMGGKETPEGTPEWHFGGGGGGVLVNGVGPDRSHDQGQGEGYGGGGGKARERERAGRGLRGVVLIEVFERTTTPAPQGSTTTFNTTQGSTTELTTQGSTTTLTTTPISTTRLTPKSSTNSSQSSTSQVSTTQGSTTKLTTQSSRTSTQGSTSTVTSTQSSTPTPTTYGSTSTATSNQSSTTTPISQPSTSGAPRFWIKMANVLLAPFLLLFQIRI